VKEYTEATFLKLSHERQIKVSLDLVYKIEESFEEKRARGALIKKLREHLEWICKIGDHSKIKPSRLLQSIEGEPNLRKILTVAMAFERKLALSLKDESILVKTQDSLRAKSTSQPPLYLVLDNLRSAHNVGSIFRSADCLGVKHIFLVGYTATPEDKAVKKTAMGSEDYVSWSHVEKIEDLILQLKNDKISLAALETVVGSVPIENAKTPQNLALFLGNERFGLDSKHLEHMDHILEIPMQGRKNSLNVSNACAIAVFEILRSWR
jgi:tRNA G18 (ribose-2'-O)-methylase SpoU